MTYNFKKAQKINDSVMPQSSALPASITKRNLSLQDTSVVSYNAMLEKDRRKTKEVTHEARLDEARKKATSAEKVTEGSLEDVESSLYPHRQFKDGEDNYQVSPINALAHANDKKYRDAFSKANKGADTAFWDKYVGDQLDGPVTKVPSNIPPTGSQLQNNPERFGSLDNLPVDPSAKVNRKNFSTELDIKPMHGFAGNEKSLKMAMSSLKDADGLLFGIYFKAAQENRDLTKNERDLVSGINKDKALIMSQVVPVPGDPANQADFLDGSPDVTDDPFLSAQMSGIDTSKAEITPEEEAEAAEYNGFSMSEIPIPPSELPGGVNGGTDVSNAGLVNDTDAAITDPTADPSINNGSPVNVIPTDLSNLGNNNDTEPSF